MAVQPADNFNEVLPGTKRLFTDEWASVSGDSQLEKHGDIILVPRPTKSPNDPLNWSLARKSWHSVLVCYIVALTAATSNVAGAASVGVNEQYGISYDVFNTGAGVLFIGIGYWTLLSSPAVHLYGRRILYLVGTTWGLIGNIWFGLLDNKADTIWSQLFVGASESVAEAVVQLSLLDIWFEHQNGTSLGFYTLATSVGTYIGPLIGGHVASSSLGWRWIGYLGAIASGVTLILFYFGLEETAFQRNRYLDRNTNRERQDVDVGDADTSRNAASPHDDSPLADRGEVRDEKSSATTPAAEVGVSIGIDEEAPYHSGDLGRRFSLSYTRPKTYWERIAVITPAPNLRGLGFQQYVSRLWHTLRIFTFPAVWFAGLQWGMQNVALSFYLTVQEDTWSGPPWNYSDAAVGNMNLPCLIGSVIGCFYGGYCSDLFLLWMTRRNRGIMEAEFRLYLMFLCVAIFPAGMLLFGIGSAKGWDWPVPYLGLGFIGFGYGCAGDLSITYLADSYPDMVLEGMVGVAVINNSLAMVFTFVASYWLDTGLQNCFIELGVLSFVVLMLSLPMILWGKQWRRWTKDQYITFLRIRDGMDD
ncbi:major facilitator superfamily domain-containing protein [Ilyonectria robusta]|uniref:major facilitator superfamily domain-containing protein n=1 Tax=Ilyonectria robusta TaxID=1079257 RepID=UPI001E8DDC0F|nr:major facilitator superfamily domain-containing protein [Ilyonectria robusta]KAH8684012.1 major facilitator superfamily domain-containing protein [Ilyonectria robusta]